MTRKYPPVAERFWARVDRRGPDECWEWQGTRISGKYGRLARDGYHVWAHRLAWELENGPIPDGLLVCHRCDNPPCCNPAHLFLGTYADNARDRDLKGHRILPPQQGSHNPQSRLTEDQVRGIRVLLAQGTPRSEVAVRYGVGRQAISKIANGRRWTHVVELVAEAPSVPLGLVS